MRRSTIIGIAALLVAGFCAPALATEIEDPTKWIQEPDMVTGFDIQSQWNPNNPTAVGFDPGVIKADDWVCNGLPIIDIHWWGSYVLNEEITITGFRINIYNNDEGDLAGIHDDKPGDLSQSYFVLFNDANETYIGDDQNYIPPKDEYEHVYLYSWDLPEGEPYDQTVNTRYWLSIVAETPDVYGSDPMWGWHTGFEPVGLDTTNAVDGNVEADSLIAEGFAPDWAHMTYNMAFVLTTIPEPGVYALFGLGALVLLAFRRRKK